MSADKPFIVDACVVMNPAGVADLVEARLRALDGRVDLCVVLLHGEAGALKTDRFQAWSKRLVVATLPAYPDDVADNEWARDKHLRGTLPGVLKRCAGDKLRPGDVVMISSEEELPDPRVVRAAAEATANRYGAMSFQQTIYCAQFAWRLRHAWCGTVVTTVDRLMRHGAQFFRDGRDGWDAVLDGGACLTGFGRGVTDTADDAHRQRASPPEWWPVGYMPDGWFVVSEDDEDEDEVEDDPPLPQ